MCPLSSLPRDLIHAFFRAASGHRWLPALLIIQLAFGILAMTVSLPSMQE